MGQRQQQSPGGDWFQERAAGGGEASTPWEAAFSSASAAAAAVQWVVVEAETLTADERSEALRMPVTIGQAVASRVAARVIRWAATGSAADGAGAPGQAAASSSGSAKAAAPEPSAAASAAAASGAGLGASQQQQQTQPTPPQQRQQSSSASASQGSSSRSFVGRQPAATMRPLSVTSSRPSSSSAVSALPGSGAPRYRATAAGSSVIVRPMGSAAAAKKP